MRTLNVIKSRAQNRLRATAAVVIVTTLFLKQTDDLASLFENAEVEFRSPDGSIKGIITDGTVNILATQEQVLNGIQSINPSSEPLPLADQLNNLDSIIQGYKNFADAVTNSAKEIENLVKQARAKKVKSVAQALDIVKDGGVFISKVEPQVEQPQPAK